MTEKVNIALSKIRPIDGEDLFPTQLLTSELESQKIRLNKAVESDSYKRVKVAENIIIELCDAINVLRDEL